jgi:hypothetical protein
MNKTWEITTSTGGVRIMSQLDKFQALQSGEGDTLPRTDEDTVTIVVIGDTRSYGVYKITHDSITTAQQGEWRMWLYNELIKINATSWKENYMNIDDILPSYMQIDNVVLLSDII